MATRIYTSEGQAALVSRNDEYGLGGMPRIIRFDSPEYGETDPPACYFHMMGFELHASANSQFQKTLDRSLYYNSYGTRPLQLKINGLVIIPTASNIDGYPSSDDDGVSANGEVGEYMQFIEDNLASANKIDSEDTVVVSIQDSRTYRCLMVDSRLMWKGKGLSRPMFTFQVSLAVLQKE